MPGTVNDRVRLIPQRWKLAAAAVLVLAAVILTDRGLRPAPKPPPLHVRAIRIQDDETTFHWKWTFTSGRHWATFGSADRSGEHIVTLERVEQYAGPVERLLLPLRRGRTRTITYEVNARREARPTAPGLTGFHVTTTMLGDNGGSPSSSRSESAQFPDGEWSLRFKALRTTDGHLDLPARVPLAVIGGTTHVLVFP